MEFSITADRCSRLGLCGMEMERKSHHLEFSSTVRYNNTGFDISLFEIGLKMLPDKIFMIGAPGSRWSGIAQNIEDNIAGFNVSDRSPDRTYVHHNFSGHVGTYFGTGWEYSTDLNESNINAPYPDLSGTRILKSHEWAYCLDDIKEKYPTSWIFLVFRPDMSCYSWWHEAGGFTIKYPDYIPYYRDSANMLCEIVKQNQAIMKFAQKYDLSWRHISGTWIQENFGQYVEPSRRDPDTLVTIFKP